MLIDLNTFDLSKFWNRYQIVRSYTGGAAHNPAHPVELVLEITDYCNLACPMCPRPNMTRQLGHMKFEAFKKIIDEVKDYIELVYLSGGLGEPLMHPRFVDMVRYAVQSGVRLGISSNATLLRPKFVDAILDAGPSLIMLSLDGATAETHESIRVGSKFVATMRNVEHFLNEKARRGLRDPFTIVQMIYMPENQHEADMFYERWKSFTALDSIRLKQFLDLQGASRVPGDPPPLESHEKLSCILPWRQLSIAWDGTLALCCADLNFKNSMGNVETHTIEALWNSEKMVRYRGLLSTGRKSEIDICEHCSTRKTNPVTRFGAVVLDDLSIRKLLPIVEKVSIKFGLKVGEY